MHGATASLLTGTSCTCACHRDYGCRTRPVERALMAAPSSPGWVPPVRPSCRLRAPDQQRLRGRGDWRVDTQGVGERGQVVAAIFVLAEDAAGDQCPHQPAQRIGIRGDAARQVVEGQRSVPERIGDAEFVARVNCLRHPCPQKEVCHDDRRRRQPLMESVQMVAHMLDESDQSCGRNLRGGRSWHFIAPMPEWRQVVAAALSRRRRPRSQRFGRRRSGR